MNLNFKQELYEADFSYFRVFVRPIIQVIFIDTYLKVSNYGFDENIPY